MVGTINEQPVGMVPLLCFGHFLTSLHKRYKSEDYGKTTRVDLFNYPNSYM